VNEIFFEEEDFTSMGKEISPLTARRSKPSDPAALTTKNGFFLSLDIFVRF
jgi:hypothetical protein